MNIKRSYFQLLMASVGVGLFLANCTVKESDGDDDDDDNTGDTCKKGTKDTGCECPGGVVGYQVCSSEGVFGSCVCPSDGTSGSGNTSGSGGTSSEGGTTANGGSAGKASGAGTGGTSGEGGAGGEGGAELGPFDDCDTCLSELCGKEFDACLADEQCISAEVDGSGQYERIATCIEVERLNGVVKRDVVRGCGVTIGASPDPDLASDWAPEGMSVNTTNLLNCLATSSANSPNAEWANSDDNYPIVNDVVKPTPWPEDSCAALACTSKL